MQNTLFALSLGFAGLILATQAAIATPACAQRKAVVAQLADRYQETRRGIGMTTASAVLEVFASDTGSWTITVTLPSGMTCLVATGQGWEDLAEQLPAKGDPA
jgi:hypothetical protein